VACRFSLRTSGSGTFLIVSVAMPSPRRLPCWCQNGTVRMIWKPARRRQPISRPPRPGRSRSDAEAELAAGDDDRRAAGPPLPGLLARALDPGEQRAGPADLGALGDLDLLAEGDPAVAGQVPGQRARCRAGGRVLGDPVAGDERPRLPAPPGTGQA